MTQRKCGICGEEGHNARTCPAGADKGGNRDTYVNDAAADSHIFKGASKKTTMAQTLSRALHAAQWSAKKISKDSRNKFSNYDYCSAESLMELWTDIAGRNGLSLFPLELNIRYTPGDPPTLSTTWLLSHIKGEDRTLTMDWPIIIAKGKPMDKAIASARTSSLGYLIRDLLIAPRVNPTDDMDHDQNNQAPAKKRTYAPKPTHEDDVAEFWKAVESFGHSRDTINGYCQMRGAKMPGDMNRKEHTRMLEWLISQPGREKIESYIKTNQPK